MEEPGTEPSPGGRDALQTRTQRMDFWLDRARFDKAVEEGHGALAIDPELAEIHQKLGWAYWHLDAHKKAEKHLRSALQSDPEDSWTRSMLSLVMLSRKKLSAADREAVEALFRDPDDTSAWYALGASALGDDTHFTRECVTEIQKRDPEHVGAFWLRAQAALVDDKANAGEVARVEYEAALRIEPDSAWLQAELGSLYLDKLGDLKKAQMHLEAAAAQDPTDRDVQGELERLRVRKDRMLRVLYLPWTICKRLWNAISDGTDGAAGWILGWVFVFLYFVLTVVVICWGVLLFPVVKLYEWGVVRAGYFSARWEGRWLGRPFGWSTPVRVAGWLGLSGIYLGGWYAVLQSSRSEDISSALMLMGLVGIGLLVVVGTVFTIWQSWRQRRRKKMMAGLRK